MPRRHNGEGSIYPYRNGFAAHVWITTPEGRRQRKSVYGKTREEVHGKWLRLHEQARRGPVHPRSPALVDFLNRWLAETVRPSLAPASVANYELFVRLYIVPDLGRRKVEKLAVRDVQVWLNALRDRCQCCAQGKDAARDASRCCAAGSCCRQVASEWTVHQAWTVLRSALSAAMREELVARNVAALVRVPVPRSRKSVVWSVEEARRFLESARAEDDPLYAGYVLMLVLGLRRGELLGLAWDDVDVAGQEAHICWQLQRVGGELMRRRTKTASSDAPLPLPDICVKALEQRRVTEARWRLAAGEAWSGFGSGPDDTDGRPVGPTELPPLVQGPGGEGRRTGDLGACHQAHLCVSAGRPRRASTGRDGDPATQPDRGDDGRLLSGVLGIDTGCAQAARKPTRGGNVMSAYLRPRAASESPRHLLAGCGELLVVRGFCHSGPVATGQGPPPLAEPTCGQVHPGLVPGLKHVDGVGAADESARHTRALAVASRVTPDVREVPVQEHALLRLGHQDHLQRVCPHPVLPDHFTAAAHGRELSPRLGGASRNDQVQPTTAVLFWGTKPIEARFRG